MNELLAIDEEKLRTSSPEEIAAMIIEASKLIEDSRNSAESIRNRSLLLRVFRNSTRDSANLMLDQNKALGIFLRMLQINTLININNAVVLARISEELNRHEVTWGDNQNRYVEVAKSFISQTYASAVAFKEQFDHLFNTVDKQGEAIDRHERSITAWGTQASSLVKQARQARLIAVAGLITGLVGWLGMAYMLIY